MRTCCSFCWQSVSTPKVTNHSAKDCALLKKFNDKHTTNKYKPITLDSGTIVANTSKEPVNAEDMAKRLTKVIEELEDRLAKMDSRLKAVENSPTLKRKRRHEDPSTSTSNRRLAKQQKDDMDNTTDELDARPLKKGKDRWPSGRNLPPPKATVPR